MTMTAVQKERPAHGLTHESGTGTPLFGVLRRQEILIKAWHIGMTLSVDGRALRFYPKGSEITMDGNTSLGTSPKAEKNDKHFEVTQDVIMEQYDVTPAAGCGVGYFGSHLTREQATARICETWNDTDFIVLASTLGLNHKKVQAAERGEIPARVGRG